MASAVTTKIEHSRNIDREIIGEIYRALVLLGAKSDLLSSVGSWGESMPKEDVLADIRAWNEATLAETKGRIEHYETSFPLSVGIRAEGQ